MIVLDASATADFLLRRQPYARWVEQHLAHPEETFHAPHLIAIEVASVVRRAALWGALTADRALQALRVLVDLDLARYPHIQLLDRIWQLRENLTAADAAYVALAEALGATLVTTDAALARATGHRARVACFSPS